MSIPDKLSRTSMHTSLLVLAVTAVVIVLALVGTISYLGGVKLVKENLEDVYRSELVQLNKQLAFQMKEIEKACQLAATDQRLISLLVEAEKQSLAGDQVALNKTGTAVESILAQYMVYSDNIEAINLAGLYNNFMIGQIYFYNYPLAEIRKNAAVYQPLVSTSEPYLFPIDGRIQPETIIPGVHVSLNILFSQPSYGIQVRHPADNRELGCIFVITKDDFLRKVLSSHAEIQLLGLEQEVFWSNRPIKDESRQYQFIQQASESTGIVEITTDGRMTDGYFLNSELGDYRLVFINHVEDFKQRLNQVRNLVLISVLITFLAAGLLSRLMLRSTLRLLEKLIDRLNRFRRESEQDGQSIDMPLAGYPSFRAKLLIYFTTILLLPVLIFSLVFYGFFINLMEREVSFAIQAGFSQMAGNMDSMIETQKNIIISIALDPEIQAFIANPADDPGRIQIQNLLENKMKIGQYHDSVSLYAANGQMLIRGYGYTEAPLSQNYSKLASDNQGQVTIAGTAVNDFNARQIVMVAQISRRDPFHQGFVLLAFDEAEVERIYRDSLSAGIAVYVEQNDGPILSHIDKQLIGQQAPGSGSARTYVLRQGLVQAPWQLVMQYNYTSIYAGTRQFFTSLVLATTGIALFFLLILFVISNIYVKPLNRLRKSIVSTGQALELTSTDGFYFSEISALVRAYNDMILRINSLIDEVLVAKMTAHSLEAQKRDLEMIALQAQINPHFLCNTLESIKWTIISRDTEKAVHMIESLNDLFRYGISRIENIIRVRQEIAYARSYTEIIQIRYSRRIEFEWQIDEAVLEDMTPKLILQPMIENAIYHGIEPAESDGRITVICKAEDADIVYVVMDNGVGMTQEKLDALRQQSLAAHPAKIGLANVNARIRLYYGTKYGVHIDSQLEAGTTITIRIPRQITG